MTEPSLALQRAIHVRLLNNAAFAGLVPADAVRDGSARPKQFPCVIIGDGQTVLAGHSGVYRNVTVHLDLHVWSGGENIAAAKAIGGAAWNAIGRTIDVPGFDLTDGVHVERSVYMRDPRGDCTHGVITVRAVMGFRP